MSRKSPLCGPAVAVQMHRCVTWLTAPFVEPHTTRRQSPPKNLHFFGKGPDQGKWTTYANAPSHVHGCVCVLIIPGCIPSGHLFPLRLVTLSSLARPKCQVTCSVYPKKKKKTARLHASNSRPRRSGHKNFVN